MKSVYSVTTALALVGSLGLMSCGTSQEPVEKTSKADAAFLKAEYEKLPVGMMVRVPVDANGKEMTDKAEMRATSLTSIASGDAAEKAFEEANTVQALSSLDELNADSSTQQWFYSRQVYRSYGNCVGGCGGGYQKYKSVQWGWGAPTVYPAMNSNYHWNYSNPCYWQRPVMNNCGYSNCNSYRYYYYQRPSCGGYSYCGGMQPTPYNMGGYNGGYGMMGNGATYGATGYGNPTQGGMYNNQYNQYNMQNNYNYGGVQNNDMSASNGMYNMTM
jgi:hypothetical protein